MPLGRSYPGTGGHAVQVAVGTCTIVVTYTPTNCSVHSDTIVLNYSNGASSQTAERALTGTGLNPATLTVSGGIPTPSAQSSPNRNG